MAVLVESFSLSILSLEKATFSEVRESGGSSNTICVRRFGGVDRVEPRCHRSHFDLAMDPQPQFLPSEGSD